MTDLKQEEFEQKIARGERPVVADFWAPWCGYCRRIAPVLDRMEQTYGDRVDFVKINVDDNGALAERFEVDTIPTLLLFMDGEMKSAVVNPPSQAAIEHWLEEHNAL